MASAQSTVDYIVDQLGGTEIVTAKKMFGEYGIYLSGKMVAMVCDGQLFVKLSDGGRKFIGTPKEAPPYPGAKPCFLISGEKWDDSSWLRQLVEITAAELPAAKKRKSS